MSVTSAVRGTVFDDANDDGTQDDGESGLSGVGMELLDADGNGSDWDVTAVASDLNLAGVVALDRTIFEDAEIFATALHQMRKISKRDWETYQGFYHAILDAIRPPDLMIYLRCSMRTLRQRIRLRGRTIERDVPQSYLKRLDRLYEEWIASYDMSDVLVLETDTFDYIHDLVHRLDVMERIEAMLPKEIGRPRCRWCG